MKTIPELIAMVPPQHKRIINGEETLSEIGVIHLCTLVEKHLPHLKDTARHLRYGCSAFAAEKRKEARNGK